MLPGQMKLRDSLYMAFDFVVETLLADVHVDIVVACAIAAVSS